MTDVALYTLLMPVLGILAVWDVILSARPRVQVAVTNHPPYCRGCGRPVRHASLLCSRCVGGQAVPALVVCAAGAAVAVAAVGGLYGAWLLLRLVLG